MRKGPYLFTFLMIALTSSLARSEEPITSATAKTAAQGFTSFEEFFTALKEMPIDEFSEFGKHTPTDRIRLWHSKLPRAQIEDFSAWNIKLRTLPTHGYVNQPGLLDLKAASNKTEIKPFTTIEELTHSVEKDLPRVYRARLRATSGENLEKWGELLSVEKPEFLKAATEKSQVFREIGFGDKNWVIREPFASKQYVGFGRKSPTPISSYEEFMSLIAPGKLQELKARAFYTQAEFIGEWLGKLKATEPAFYQLFATSQNISSRVGFLRAGEVRENVDRRVLPARCDLQLALGAIFKK